MKFLTNGSIIFSIILTISVLWLSIRRYEGFFSERKIFISLIIGFFTGFAGFIIHISLLYIGLIFIVVLPFIEQFLKFLGINLPSFQGKRETIIYGLVIGLGFGSIYMPLLVLYTFKEIGSDFVLGVGSFLVGIGIILFHGATGCVIGYGVYSEESKWKYLMYAVLLGMVISTTEVISQYPQDFYLIGIVVAEFIYPLFLFFIVQRKILPMSLPRSKRKDILHKTFKVF